MSGCQLAPQSGLGHFWTTQPSACEEWSDTDACGNVSDCQRPGLLITRQYADCDMRGPYVARQVPDGAAEDGAFCPPKTPRLIGATIATDNFIRSLAINILMTDAPNTDACVLPGKRGGYWADSYRKDGLYTGSKLQQMSTNGTMTQLARLGAEYVRADLQKLVTYGVASKISVTATYLGGASIRLDCVIEGDLGPTTFSIAGQRLASSWAWAA